MPFLLDTGILLRLINADDSAYATVEQAVDSLIARREQLLITTQNLAELWNVATRPTANNGLGLSPSKVADLFVQTIDPICAVVTEIDSSISEFRRLLAKYAVVGKQVHDARLVAMMLAWQIENTLTLNDCDFRRYEPEGIRVVTPDSPTSASP
jgi:predicted nucleic acid-binding protein